MNEKSVDSVRIDLDASSREYIQYTTINYCDAAASRLAVLQKRASFSVSVALLVVLPPNSTFTILSSISLAM